MKILTNRAFCRKCGVTVESKSIYDFKACKCRNVFVDGGLEYLRHGWEEKDQYVNLSDVDYEDDDAD